MPKRFDASDFSIKNTTSTDTSTWGDDPGENNTDFIEELPIEANDDTCESYHATSRNTAALYDDWINCLTPLKAKICTSNEFIGHKHKSNEADSTLQWIGLLKVPDLPILKR